MGRIRFIEIAEELTQRVENKLYTTGQRLPSEYDLAKEFSASRLTIRKAIDLLCQQNILVKEKGKGTYVMKQGKIHSGENGLVSFTQAAREKGKQATSEILTLEVVETYPIEVTKFFKDSFKGEVLHLVRRRFLEAEPLVLEEVYVPESFLQGVSKQDLADSLFDLLEKEVEIGYSHQEIEAVGATEDLAKLLAVEKGQALLLVYSLTYSPAGRPLLYSKSFYRGDRCSFENVLVRRK